MEKKKRTQRGHKAYLMKKTKEIFISHNLVTKANPKRGLTFGFIRFSMKGRHKGAK